MKFRYVEPTIEYKKEALDYLKETIDSKSRINGMSGLNRYQDDYEGWLKRIEEQKKDDIVKEGLVPAGEYFLVDENDRIIGMANIRYSLNEKLRKIGGNIGYSIRPCERGKGYNKINLYCALKICKEKGIKNAILTADVDNPASWRTMERLGGELEEEFETEEGIIEKRYIINVDKSLEENKDIYEKYLMER